MILWREGTFSVAHEVLKRGHLYVLVEFSLLWHVNVRSEIDVSSRGEWSKKSVQQGRSLFDARSVLSVREHGKRATCLREALRRRQGTPLAAFFNIPLWQEIQPRGVALT